MGEELPLLPETQPNDDEDVVWGLQTATALWARGERREALIWVRRSAEAAGSAGDDMRAVDLAKRAVAMEEYIQAIEAAPPPSAAPKPLISFPESAGGVPAAALVPLPAPPAAPTVRTAFDIADELTTDYEGELDPIDDRASLYEGELDPIADRASGAPDDHGGGDELTVPRLDLAQMQKALEFRSRPPVAPGHHTPPPLPAAASSHGHPASTQHPASQQPGAPNPASAHPVSSHPGSMPQSYAGASPPPPQMHRPTKTPPMGLHVAPPPSVHRPPKTPPMGQPMAKVPFELTTSPDIAGYVVPSQAHSPQPQSQSSGGVPSQRGDTPRIPPVTSSSAGAHAAAGSAPTSAGPPTAPSAQAGPSQSVSLSQTTPSAGIPSPMAAVHAAQTVPPPVVVEVHEPAGSMSERSPPPTARFATKAPPPPPRARSATLQPGSQGGFTPVSSPPSAVSPGPVTPLPLTSSSVTSASMAAVSVAPVPFAPAPLTPLPGSLTTTPAAPTVTAVSSTSVMAVSSSTVTSVSSTSMQSVSSTSVMAVSSTSVMAAETEAQVAANLSATAQRAARKKPRAPILDPWADEFPIDDVPNTRQTSQSIESGVGNEDDVFTSAPPLESTLRRKPPPPPPVVQRRAAGTVLADSPPLSTPEPSTRANGDGARPPPPPVPRRPTLTGAPNPLLQSDGASDHKSTPPPVLDGAANSIPPAAQQTRGSDGTASVPPPGPERPKSAPPPPPVERAKSSPPPAPEQRKTAPPPAPAPEQRKSAPPPAPASPPVAPSIPAPPQLERPKSAPPPLAERRKSAPPPVDPQPELRRPRSPTPPPLARETVRPGSMAPPARPATESRPPSAGTIPPAERSVAGFPLDRIDAFADLPGELQRTLARSAELVELGDGDESKGFGLLLVTAGVVDVCANIADIAAIMVVEGGLISAFTSVSDTVAVRAVAPGRAKVAAFSRESTEEALKSCPWVLDELIRMGDRFAALVGATMGPLGDLDDDSRRQTLDRFKVRALRAGEMLAAKGSDNQGLIVVGAGTIVTAESQSTLSSGDLLFPDTVLDGSATPHDVRAGEGGALILSASRSTTVELFSTFPTLLELLRVA